LWSSPVRRVPVGAMGAWVALGVGLRLAWVLAVPSRPVGDFALYRESAAYLVAHGALDPEFIYMPGYVFLLAAIEWLGGGLLAAKMIGVAAGGVVTFAAGGIAEQLFGRRAGIAAAALGALWPAGIAVASVTGTDLPAGALAVLGVWVMVRLSRTRPSVAAALAGLLFGLGAWIRAVTVPLAALSFFFWWATEGRSTAALRRTAMTVGVALVVLLPWGLRNRLAYGEFFLTDSHGGHTALVGANPNTEGTYSRSLNLMFTQATGYRLTDVPARHRASDRAAYELAKGWSAFEPLYALGLLGAKADRLLSHERNLLYWPIFRQGVLPDRSRAFEDAHRTGLERLADGYWYGVIALFVAGVALVGGGRDRRPLALLVFPAAMVAIYASFFSEVRYHLAIVPLLFPLAAFALRWGIDAGRVRFAGEGRRVARVAGAIAGTFTAWILLVRGGEVLRARHRFAVAICAYPSQAERHLCAWRRSGPPGGVSPVRGVWDGVGLRLAGGGRTDDVLAAATTELPLPPGRYRVRARGSFVGPAGAAVAVSMAVGDVVIARVRLTSPERDDGVPLEGAFDHEGGPLALEAAAEASAPGLPGDGGTVWLTQLEVERFSSFDLYSPAMKKGTPRR
jgi:hypothetical protein